MLEKIFNRTKKKDDEEAIPVKPSIQFGRYSDNNKPIEKVEKWNRADLFFKEKKWAESIAAFFDYLKDDAAQNVIHEQKGTDGTFCFYQGSKVIRGYYNAQKLEAEVALVAMAQPSVPVMRRLLEMNLTLYYTRYALKGDQLRMLFDSDIEAANPSKLYYGLKELATKADKQDDLLVNDFTTLQAVDVDHIIELPVGEKEIKYKYLQKWIKETLDLIATVDSDKYSGGIAYLLLALTYRIDFLILPEGKLLLNLERIVDIYFRKDDRPVTEKNSEMIEEFTMLQAKTREEIFPCLFRSRYTFSIVTPQNYKTVADAIYNANQNIAWYKENKHPLIAAQISEYGIAYCQYSYSLPRPVTEFFLLFMMVNYSDYFGELGYTTVFYNKEKEEFNKEALIAEIGKISEEWQSKYPDLSVKVDKLNFENIISFNQTFTTEIEYLNLETNR